MTGAALVEKVTDAMAQPSTCLYKARGEQTEALYVNDQRISRVYDALGRALGHADLTGVTPQSDDAHGMLQTVVAPSHPHGAALTYGFDANRQSPRWRWAANATPSGATRAAASAVR